MTEIVFPQGGDFDDAENFGALIGQSNMLDYVETGMSVTLNAGVPDCDVTAGKAFVSETNATGSQGGKEHDIIGLVVEKDAQTGIGLTDSTTNYLWLDANTGTNDAAQYTVTTVDSAPTDFSFKIAEIDTAGDTVTEVNRSQNPAYETLDLSEALNLSGDIDLEGASDDSSITLDDNFNLSFDNNAGTPIMTVLEAGGVEINTGDLIDGSSNIVYDQSNNWVPDARIEQASLDAQTVKGNDIDSNGDGKVDSADSADNATALQGNSAADVTQALRWQNESETSANNSGVFTTVSTLSINNGRFVGVRMYTENPGGGFSTGDDIRIRMTATYDDASTDQWQINDDTDSEISGVSTFNQFPTQKNDSRYITDVEFEYYQSLDGGDSRDFYWEIVYTENNDI